MRRATFIAAAMSAAFALASLVPVASAAVVTNESVPISGYATNPCNGEDVYLSGVAHVVYRSTSDGAGGFNAGVHENYSDLQGSGDQGNNYVANGATNESLHLQPGEVLTLGDSFNLISKGSAPNLTVHELIHYTVNANGDLTAYIDNFSIDCRG